MTPLLLVSLLLSSQLEVSAVSEHIKDIQLTCIDRDQQQEEYQILVVGKTIQLPQLVPVTIKGKVKMKKIVWRNERREIVSGKLPFTVPSKQHFYGRVDDLSENKTLHIEALSKQQADEANEVKKQLQKIDVATRLSGEQLIAAKNVVEKYYDLSEGQQYYIAQQQTVASVERIIEEAEAAQALKKEALSLIVSPTIEVGYDVTKAQLSKVLTDVLQSRVSTHYYVKLNDTLINHQEVFATATLMSTETQQQQRVPVKMTIKRTTEKQETLNVAREKAKYENEIAAYVKEVPTEKLFQNMQRQHYVTSEQYERARVQAARAHTALERLEAYQAEPIVLNGPKSRLNQQLRAFLDEHGDTDITFELKYKNNKRFDYLFTYKTSHGAIKRHIVVQIA